ncbi:MAG TPA: DUF2066 domain-containing protein [Pseudolabrys sp.]|nr:DUF2066 domain-containing protein [Pseudolabrys sp.]
MRISTPARFVSNLLALIFVGCGTDIAANTDDLYRAQAIVTGQREETRGAGFTQCLTDVLVKLSGDPRLFGDPRVAAMGAQAGSFVREFHYRDRMAGIPVHDEQGTRDRPYDLMVRFHPAEIDAALRTLGREPWLTPRPRVVVFVSVRHGPTTYVLASDGRRGPGMADSLKAAADRVGMPVTLPEQAALARAGLSLDEFTTGDFNRFDATARAMGGDLGLVGLLEWNDEALGWIAEWRLRVEGKPYQWQARGVNFDEAFRRATRGAVQILSGHGQPN